MLWSGSSSRAGVRDSMWGLLLFAGAAWLAIGWSVLRLEPSDVVTAASAVLFFGALCEVVRALVGMKTWWLNAGMAVLFAATGGVLLADRGEAYTTPLSLVAWFLMVRGALDVAVSVMNRGVDRTWGLVMTLGLVQAGLGFAAATPPVAAADPVIVTLGGLAMLRALADLTTSLRLREVAHAHHDVLELPPERQAGVAGYSAGLADFPAKAAEPAGSAKAAGPAGSAKAAGPTYPAMAAGSMAAEPAPAGRARHRAESFHDEVVRTTADLDTMIKNAGVTGTGGTQQRIPDKLPPVPDTPEGAASTTAAGENA
ncbi:hypothetical protein [Actinoplanes sp. NPDC051411]|uniref:hypothetical protein n=1 Tax=Actinoplanes sp. NPDC051411 TaxID=3155522 RepID=UPI00341A0085